MMIFGPVALIISLLQPEVQRERASTWVAAHCVLPGGALRVRPGGHFVSGYFGSMTADGLVRARMQPQLVLGWMAWYVAHAHGSGSGIDGVADDATVRDGVETSRGRPDSTDAYGAVFLSLARDAYESGDPSLRAFVVAHHADLVRIADSSIATLQPIGLTWARPNRHVFYAIDNEQVMRGMRDAAALMREAFDDRANARRFDRAAATVARALRAHLWDDRVQAVRPYEMASGRFSTPDPGRIYPDALAQLFAVVDRVPSLSFAQRQTLASRVAASVLAQSDALDEAALVALVAERDAGIAVRVPAFHAPPLCANAGWYLRVASEPTAPSDSHALMPATGTP